MKGNQKSSARVPLTRARSARRNLIRQPSDGPPAHPKQGILRKAKSTSNVRFRGVAVEERRSAWGDTDSGHNDMMATPPSSVERQPTQYDEWFDSSHHSNREYQPQKKATMQPKSVLRNKGDTLLIQRRDYTLNSGIPSAPGWSPTNSPVSTGDTRPRLPMRSAVPRSTSMPVYNGKEKNVVHTRKRWDELLGSSRNSPRRTGMAKVPLPKIPRRKDSGEVTNQAMDFVSSVRSQSDETFDSVETDATPRMSGNRSRNRQPEPSRGTRPVSLVDDEADEYYNQVQEALDGFVDGQRYGGMTSGPIIPPLTRAGFSNHALAPISESSRLALTRFRSSPAEIRRASEIAAVASSIAQSATESLPMQPRRSTSPTSLPQARTISPRANQSKAHNPGGQWQREIGSVPSKNSPTRVGLNNHTLTPISESSRSALARFRSSLAEIHQAAEKPAAVAAPATSTQSLPTPPRRNASPPPLPQERTLAPKVLQALARKGVSIVRQRRSDWKTYTESLEPPVKLSGRRDGKQMVEENTGPCYYFLASTNRKLFFDDDDQQLALALYPDSVGQSYEALVPRKVSDADFWERYFFRCSEKAIFQALQRQEQK